MLRFYSIVKDAVIFALAISSVMTESLLHLLKLSFVHSFTDAGAPEAGSEAMHSTVLLNQQLGCEQREGGICTAVIRGLLAASGCAVLLCCCRAVVLWCCGAATLMAIFNWQTPHCF